MAERSEEEVAAGLLRITVGSVAKSVPTLKAKYIDAWVQLLAPAGGGSVKPLGEWSEADVLELPGQTVGRLLDLIVAYDVSGALGGRDWLAEHADPAQLHAAVVAMLANVNPLADAPVLLDLLLLRRGARPGRPSSTSGASASGASTRTRSARGSTRSS